MSGTWCSSVTIGFRNSDREETYNDVWLSFVGNFVILKVLDESEAFPSDLLCSVTFEEKEDGE